MNIALPHCFINKMYFGTGPRKRPLAVLSLKCGDASLTWTGGQFCQQRGRWLSLKGAGCVSWWSTWTGPPWCRRAPGTSSCRCPLFEIRRPSPQSPRVHHRSRKLKLVAADAGPGNDTICVISIMLTAKLDKRTAQKPQQQSWCTATPRKWKVRHEWSLEAMHYENCLGRRLDCSEVGWTGLLTRKALWFVHMKSHF